MKNICLRQRLITATHYGKKIILVLKLHGKDYLNWVIIVLNPTRGHQITVNENLNPYAFVITYLHEVAHYKVNTIYKRRKLPHGKEWKTLFKELMLPVLNSHIFPEEVLSNLHNYLQDPKASSCADLDLLKSLRIYDQEEDGVLLSALKQGEIFKISGRDV